MDGQFNSILFCSYVQMMRSKSISLIRTFVFKNVIKTQLIILVALAKLV